MTVGHFCGALKMAIKDLLSRTNSWLRNHKLSRAPDYQPQIDNDGLISPDAELSGQPGESQSDQTNQVMVKTVQSTDKSHSLEKIQVGFDKLVEQLQGINEHLNRQVGQYENLMSQMEKMPALLESFPGVVENQKQSTAQLIEQLKTAAVRNQQFVEAVEKIPTETAKQTDALVNINHQLAAAADTDVQMTESFNKFTETLGKLDQNTVGQTDSIMQMSKTFAASDRYLKYIVSRQRKSFMWIFMVAVGVCLLAILVLAGIIIYLGR